MNSPIKRTQARGITPQIAEYISSAGRNILNEQIMKEVGGVGMALGAAFEAAKENKEKLKKDQEEFEKDQTQFSVGADQFFKEQTDKSNFGNKILKEVDDYNVNLGNKVDFTKLFTSLGNTAFSRVKENTDSNLTSGGTFVEKELPLSTPSFLASGALAGYNETVERRNYKKQVAADFQDYLSQQLSDLNPEATGYNMIDISLRDSMNYAKVRMAELLETSPENRDLQWNLEYDQLRQSAKTASASGKNIAAQIKKIKEEYSDIDFNASNSESTDIYNTITRAAAGTNGTFGHVIDRNTGVSRYLGASNGKKPLNFNANNIANGELLASFVRKQDADKDIEDFSKKAEEITRTYERENLGTTTVAVAEDKVRAAGKQYFLSLFDNEDTLRGYASAVLGVDYDAFNALKIKQAEKGAPANLIENLVADKMADTTINRMGMYFQQRAMTKGNKIENDGETPPSRSDLIRKRAMEILSVTPKGTLSEGDRLSKSFNPKFDLILGKKGVGRVEQIGNELHIKGNEDDEGNEPVLKIIPLSNISNAVDILTNFLLEDKTYSPVKTNKSGRSAQEIYDQYKNSKK